MLIGELERVNPRDHEIRKIHNEVNKYNEIK